jgi:hypothetical protein
MAAQRIFRAVAVTLAFTISPAVASADVHGLCRDNSICNLRLDGRIGPDDAAQFKRSLEKVGGKQNLLLFLNSEGGDIATAIEIGRLVRHWQASHVVVSLDSKCFSACVFVLAGGLNRAVHGKVGIHRPFSATTDSHTYEATQKTFRELEQSAKSFFKGMNVPASLYDEMMSVPPQKLRLLTEQELARFGIGQSDPAYQDNRDAKSARGYGLDKEEYLARKERADRICNALSVNEQKAGIEATVMESANIFNACIEAVVRARPETEEEKRFYKDLQR